MAAQEGDDVVIIDMCAPDNVPDYRFASTVEPEAILERNENGKAFQVSTYNLSTQVNNIKLSSKLRVSILNYF